MSEIPNTAAIFFESDSVSNPSRGNTRRWLPTGATIPILASMMVVWEFVLLLIATNVAAGYIINSRRYPFASLSFAICFSLLAVCAFHTAQLYRTEVLGNLKTYRLRIAKLWLTLALAIIIADLVAVRLRLSQEDTPVPFVIWLAVTSIALMLGRRVMAWIFQICVKNGVITHNVVLLANVKFAEFFATWAERGAFGVRLIAVFGEDDSDQAWANAARLPIMSGGVSALLKFHKHNQIDTVVIAPSKSDTNYIRDLVRQLSLQPLKLRLLPLPMAFEMAPGWCAPAGELPGIQLMRAADPPIAAGSNLGKAIFDRFVALLAIILFGPLMLGCMVAIKICSPGPVFFMQKRIGYRNREFDIFKFRTMHVAKTANLKLTERNDPRVYAVGKLMRMLSFDELPQLLNVLRGDMSLVGPRPHMPEARAAGMLYFEAVENYARRHCVKPGITGWAQVNGWRGPTDTLDQIRNRVEHDFHYIENWSFWLDIVILVKTVFVGFFGKNAF